jgi:hypothetical protein
VVPEASVEGTVWSEVPATGRDVGEVTEEDEEEMAEVEVAKPASVMTGAATLRGAMGRSLT